MFVDNRRGFSLIELLVVIAVLGILAAVLVGVLNPTGLFGQGRDSRRLSDLTTIQSALEQYFSQNNSYPATDGVPFGAAWTPYLKTVPNDPDSTATYEYCASGTPPSNYVVCATLEDVDPSTVTGCITGTQGACAGKNCCLTNPF